MDSQSGPTKQSFCFLKDPFRAPNGAKDNPMSLEGTVKTIGTEQWMCSQNVYLRGKN